jgi:hypothetical protein
LSHFAVDQPYIESALQACHRVDMAIVGRPVTRGHNA